MLRLLRWLGVGLVGVAGLAALGAAGVWFTAQSMIDRKLPVVREPIPRASGPEAVARGGRLAVVLGCVGCHEGNLQGHFWFQDPFEPPVFTANLTLKAKQYSDEDLARIIRRGVLPDGRGVNAMPSKGYAQLNDADTADLIAYIRSVPPGGAERPPIRMGLVSRFQLLQGRFKLEGLHAQELKDVKAADLGPAHARGRYVAATVCAECHMPDLKGHQSPVGHTPDLAIAGAYDEADFVKLMRTGKAAGNREVGLMSEVARGRFKHLSDADVAALHAYLKARAEKP